VSERWTDALTVAQCIAIAPNAFGGIHLIASAGPLRERWIAHYQRAMAKGGLKCKKIPSSIEDERLLGGIDIAATLATGRPVRQLGALQEIEGGTLLLAMAERLPISTASRISLSMDEQKFSVIAMDESEADEPTIAACLRDRLAATIDLSDLNSSDVDFEELLFRDSLDELVPAQICKRFYAQQLQDEHVELICNAAFVLGVDSPRAVIAAAKLARMHCALFSLDQIGETSLSFAIRMAIAPHATKLPESNQQTDSEPGEQPEPQSSAPDTDAAQNQSAPTPPNSADQENTDSPEDSNSIKNQIAELSELILQAAIASLPPNVLASLKLGSKARSKKSAAGTSGELQRGANRGRATGVFRKKPNAHSRIHLLHTLRASVPWQRIRKSESTSSAQVAIRKDDFRYQRIEQKKRSTIIFAIDASGSSALNRLAEAKGAIELLLAQCYVRRDQVAVIAFRGKQADVVLPPTRSLARAKRSLAGLPGGGGTPLASALDKVEELCAQVQKKGETPFVVILTDGRANVARSGAGGREQAQADADSAARSLREKQVASIVLDTSPQPHPLAKSLAVNMAAIYMPLPFAGSAQISSLVNDAYRSR
jgi:magnesium chelatase subunit D